MELLQLDSLIVVHDAAVGQDAVNVRQDQLNGAAVVGQLHKLRQMGEILNLKQMGILKGSQIQKEKEKFESACLEIHFLPPIQICLRFENSYFSLRLPPGGLHQLQNRRTVRSGLADFPR